MQVIGVLVTISVLVGIIAINCINLMDLYYGRNKSECPHTSPDISNHTQPY